MRLRGTLRATARLVALASLCLLPLALLEGVLALDDWGAPSALFLPSQGDSGYLALNRRFTDVYFPPGLARPLKPTYIRRNKAGNGYRIFVLGGSAAAGFPDHTVGFARMLRVMLRHAFPDLDIEVADLATAAIDSDVVFDIARHAARFQPDLFLVYLGNNEVIGPFGPTAKLTLPAENVHVVRDIVAIRRLRVAQWVSHLWSLPASAAEWQGMQAFVDRPIFSSDPRLAAVYTSFRTNLEDIRRVALACGARILFSRVLSNLADFPPFRSEHRTDLTGPERNEWERRFQRGAAALRQGRPRDAIADWSAAERLDALPADLSFALGRAWLAAGDLAKAREDLGRARDLDGLRFRADSRINAIIEQVATEDRSGRVGYVDPSDLSPGRIPGSDLFLEHVHFSSAGNLAIARKLFERIAPLIAEDTGRAPTTESLDAADIRDALFDAPPLRAHTLRSLSRMVSHPPFSLRDGNDRLVRSLVAQADRIAAEPFRVTDRVMDALRADPDDYPIHHKAFLYLRRQLATSATSGARGTSGRSDALLHSLRELLQIRGRNGDLNRQRARWSRAIDSWLRTAPHAAAGR